VALFDIGQCDRGDDRQAGQEQSHPQEAVFPWRCLSPHEGKVGTYDDDGNREIVSVIPPEEDLDRERAYDADRISGLPSAQIADKEQKSKREELSLELIEQIEMREPVGAEREPGSAQSRPGSRGSEKSSQPVDSPR
jgi:hypothetical protein